MTSTILDSLALLDSSFAFCIALREETASMLHPRSAPPLDPDKLNEASAKFIANLRKNVLNHAEAFKENAALKARLAVTERMLNETYAAHFVQQCELQSAKEEIESLKQEIERLKQGQKPS